MKVDMHFHLEEGPYSSRWLARTIEALKNTEEDNGEFVKHSKAWVEQLETRLNDRMKKGSFSEEWLDRYLKTGRKRGITHFGLVDHLYRFKECRPYYERHMLLDDSPVGRIQELWLNQVCVSSLDEFVTFVSKAKENRSDLLLGMEADYFQGGETELKQLLEGYDWDYVIGSVHFIDGWGFDNPDTKAKFEGMVPLAMYRKYFELLKQACRTGLFDFIGHPDNLKVFNFRPEREEELLPLYHEVAEEMIRSGVATEINTGLAYRYPVAESCPSPLFISVLSEHGVPLTSSSDSHFPDDIGSMLDAASTLALQNGYTEWAIFKNRRREMVPIK
ncbi:histidinol-phosphatase HisJ family protein [Paenibacillus peoriae]|uniref:histidinol-phosphatase HisJ family protein n=1 Tax=Paenibacillus peoriae TaxID=59893 RepID=UPI00026C5B71|nr:histidinol-phosphatase HisJ family protein [Paenibacillus peoriae]MEC0183190.1 histidinol-phosphatase HisJ family protein [Paenibacillus peoriae]